MFHHVLISDWDPFAEDIGIESDCDTEEEIRRFVLHYFYFYLYDFIALLTKILMATELKKFVVISVK